MAEPSAEPLNQIPLPPSRENEKPLEARGFKAFTLSKALAVADYAINQGWEGVTNPNAIQAQHEQMRNEMVNLGLDPNLIGEMSPETAQALAQRRQEVRGRVQEIVDKVAPLIPDKRFTVIAPHLGTILVGGTIALGEQQTHIRAQIIQKIPGGKEVVQGVAKVARPVAQGLGIVK